MKLGSKINKRCTRNKFGKNISKLIIRGDELYLNLLFNNVITNKVVVITHFWVIPQNLPKKTQK